MPPRDFRDNRVRSQRLLDNACLFVVRPATPLLRSSDHLDPPNRRRLKRMVKSRHKPISILETDSSIRSPLERWDQDSAYTTTVYVHDLSDRIIAELDAAGQTQREYIWLDDMPVAVVDNVQSGSPVIYYVHVDHLMRPARMTAQDTSWVWDVIYAPFGGVSYIWSNPANIDLRFPGQWFQLESGLAYNWHRHYDATLGRYVQPDPLGLTAMLSDGPSVYGYVDGNPAAKSDRNGLQSITEERMRHILDAHGQYTRRTRPNSVFNAEYSSPEVLRDLCRSVFQDPSAPPAPLGRGGLWRLNGEVLFRNNDTGQTVPYIIGKDQQGGDTNRVEIWYDPKTGNVQTMFPIDR